MKVFLFLKGCDILLKVGIILFIISGIIIFGTDRLVRMGKIKEAKTLLKVKLSGLALAIISAFLMFYGQ